ncbi:cysteine hydrolase family protein [Cocleimonas flava]|uniref:Nicotinamidase-related amidase n=1 Tax=Cocleimonas flava TaxID=634765 RepID=A0A4R1F4Q7_9GAMM|nr:cysteine hydrolase family protein [Cocleimonas flava]TCJ87509.1 nicotinamidase-related amidase [Cocleimonas flava]
MTQGLIIVDVQNDYFTGGTMELVNMSAASENCKALLENFRNKNAPLFHIQHLAAREGATFFIPETEGCEIHSDVTPTDDEPVFVKHFPSAFRGTDLEKVLKSRGVTEVIICGAMTHMCIDTTTRAAFDLGFKCQVIHDACATKDLEFNGELVKAKDVQNAFMAALSVPFAQIVSTKEYLES